MPVDISGGELQGLAFWLLPDVILHRARYVNIIVTVEP